VYFPSAFTMAVFNSTLIVFLHNTKVDNPNHKCVNDIQTLNHICMVIFKGITDEYIL
jgi:hypothetical protein